ncbi:MAG: hypothetical protein LBS05_03625 [Tannerellaceae bacterium]|jgi:hypothetical protein|nr:hypothetical protein [Tannerellaceae bacterium]
MNDEICNSSYLLGHSQTFIGVLATLVVLCLFRGESNFIRKYLKDIGDEIMQEINKVVQGIIKKEIGLPDFENIKERLGIDLLSKDHGFMRAVASGQSRWVLEQSLMRAYAGIDKSVMSLYFTLCEGSNRDLGEAECKGNEIKDAKEFTMVALYAFFFSVIILLLDCCIPPDCWSQWYMNLFLHAFTMASYVFIGVIWRRFWKRVPTAEAKQVEAKEKKVPIKKIVKMLIIALLPVVFWYCSNDLVLHTSLLWNWSTFSLLVVYVVSLALLATLHNKKRIELAFSSSPYNNRFVSSHFLYIFLASVGITGICAVISLIPSVEFAGYFHRTQVMTCSLILFVFLNAFFLSFWLPYRKYSQLRKVYREKVSNNMQKKKEAGESKIKSAIEKYKKVVEKIKEEVTENATASNDESQP